MVSSNMDSFYPLDGWTDVHFRPRPRSVRPHESGMTFIRIPVTIDLVHSLVQ